MQFLDHLQLLQDQDSQIHHVQIKQHYQNKNNVFYLAQRSSNPQTSLYPPSSVLKNFFFNRSALEKHPEKLYPLYFFILMKDFNENFYSVSINS